MKGSICGSVEWPKKGETISDEIASRALDSGKLDIVARFLIEAIAPMIRECDPCQTTDTLYKIADALDDQRAGRDLYLRFRRLGRGAPAKDPFENLRIGARV